MSQVQNIVDVIGSSGALQLIGTGVAAYSDTITVFDIEEAVIQANVVFPSGADGNTLIEIQSGFQKEDGTVVDWDTIPYSQFEVPFYALTGTADATEALRLHDANGGFIVGLIGRRVTNSTNGTSAIVTAFVDSGELVLDTDIFESGNTWIFDTSYKSHLLIATPKIIRVKVTNQDSGSAITTWIQAVLSKQR